IGTAARPREGEMTPAGYPAHTAYRPRRLFRRRVIRHRMAVDPANPDSVARVPQEAGEARGPEGRGLLRLRGGPSLGLLVTPHQTLLLSDECDKKRYQNEHRIAPQDAEDGQ